MDASSVRKCVDIATSLGYDNAIVVRSTFGAMYSNSETSALDFDHSNNIVKYIGLNVNPTRNTTGEGKIHVEFLSYDDISSIFFKGDPIQIKYNESTIGDFDSNKTEAIYKEALKEHQATGFATPKQDKVLDEDGKIIYPNVDVNGKPIRSFDVPNVPSLI